MEATFEIQLLGPPQLWWQERPFSLPRRQVRGLLYRLAVETRPVQREELADLLWSESAPAVARRNLTRLLSYMRKQLPHPDLIRTENAAVSLNYDIVRADAALFPELCHSDNPEEWETAVSIYRGPFLSGFVLAESREFDGWQSQMQRRFEELYLQTLRRLVLDSAGEPAQAIAYARRYLAVDDLAEDIHRRLILLYAQSGDRSASLRQYEECVFALERELGVEPLPETRAAYEAVRDGSLPAAQETAPAPEWSVLPGLDLPLVGRDGPMQALARAYDRFSGGGVIFISGEAGVGKSRLMREFATETSALVLAGNNQAESSTVPYQPLIQALRQALPLRARWKGILPIWLAELSRLMPEVNHIFPGLPSPIEVEPQQAQVRIFEALRQILTGLADASPLLLCLDDIHWADESTRGWLGYAAAQLSGSKLRILVTYRPHHHRTAIADLQHALGRSGLMAEVALEGLSETAVAELLAKSAYESPGLQDLVSRVHAATGGNAFFVLEIVRELQASGAVVDAAGDLPLPATVREAVLRRAARLTPLAQQLLEITAVLSPAATFEAIREASGRGELQTAEGIDELEAFQLIESRRAQFEFHHGLARDAIYQNISDWRRRLLHRRAAAALAYEAGSDNEQLALIGAHYELARDLLPAIDYYRQAAAAASKLFAFQEAAQDLRHAIALCDQLPQAPPLLVDLYEELAENLAGAGQFSDAAEMIMQALEKLPEDNPLRLAALERKLAATLPPQQREDEAELHYRAALEHLDGPSAGDQQQRRQALRLDILLELLEVFYLQIRPEAMAGLRAEIETLLQEVGTAEQQSRYYSQQFHIKILQDRFRATEESREFIERALAYALESGSERLIFQSRFLETFQLLWGGAPREALEILKSVQTAALRLGDAWLSNQSLAYLTVAHRLLGETERTAAVLPELLDVSRRVGNPYYIGVGQANAAWLHYLAGDWRQARTEAESAAANWAATRYPFQWLAYSILLAVAVQENRLEDALTAAAGILDHKQQKLPDDLDRALAAAVGAWEAGAASEARARLKTAVDLAAQHGYL